MLYTSSCLVIILSITIVFFTLIRNNKVEKKNTIFFEELIIEKVYDNFASIFFVDCIYLFQNNYYHLKSNIIIFEEILKKFIWLYEEAKRVRNDLEFKVKLETQWGTFIYTGEEIYKKEKESLIHVGTLTKITEEDFKDKEKKLLEYKNSSSPSYFFTIEELFQNSQKEKIKEENLSLPYDYNDYFYDETNEDENSLPPQEDYKAYYGNYPEGEEIYEEEEHFDDAIWNYDPYPDDKDYHDNNILKYHEELYLLKDESIPEADEYEKIYSPKKYLSFKEIDLKEFRKTKNAKARKSFHRKSNYRKEIFPDG